MSENAWGKTTHHVWGEVDVVFAHSIVVVSRYIPARGCRGRGENREPDKGQKGAHFSSRDPYRT